MLNFRLLPHTKQLTAQKRILNNLKHGHKFYTHLPQGKRADVRHTVDDKSAFGTSIPHRLFTTESGNQNARPNTPRVSDKTLDESKVNESPTSNNIKPNPSESKQKQLMTPNHMLHQLTVIRQPPWISSKALLADWRSVLKRIPERDTLPTAWVIFCVVGFLSFLYSIRTLNELGEEVTKTNIEHDATALRKLRKTTEYLFNGHLFLFFQVTAAGWFIEQGLVDKLVNIAVNNKDPKIERMALLTVINLIHDSSIRKHIIARGRKDSNAPENKIISVILSKANGVDMAIVADVLPHILTEERWKKEVANSPVLYPFIQTLSKFAKVNLTVQTPILEAKGDLSFFKGIAANILYQLSDQPVIANQTAYTRLLLELSKQGYVTGHLAAAALQRMADISPIAKSTLEKANYEDRRSMIHLPLDFYYVSSNALINGGVGLVWGTLRAIQHLSYKENRILKLSLLTRLRTISAVAGCTALSSMAFGILFPYAVRESRSFLQQSATSRETAIALELTNYVGFCALAYPLAATPGSFWVFPFLSGGCLVIALAILDDCKRFIKTIQFTNKTS